jgi:hypothetical protein
MKIAPNVRRTVLVILLLICASAAQGVWANAMRISGARPDFVLITAILCSQFCSAIEGAVIGLGAGLLSGSLASPFDGGYGSIVVSRTLVCFGVGWLEERVFRDNAAIAIALVSGGTLLAEGAFYVFDPHFPAVRWARSVGLELIYNVCLALPIYLAVRISMRPRKLATTGQIS